MNGVGVANSRYRRRAGLVDVDWIDHGACAGRSDLTDLFFIASGDEEQHDPARRICVGCPVKAACLEYALANGIDHGVWGGASEHERRVIRGARRRAAAGEASPNRMREARLGKGLSQRRLAQAVGLSPSAGSISYIERGIVAPSCDVAVRLAEVLDVPVTDLFPRFDVAADAAGSRS